MKVMVAGATGAIGRPLVSALLAKGHEVIGMSSSENGARILREKGAGGEVANALDENAVLALVRRVKPNALIEELTSLPKRYTPEEMKAGADAVYYATRLRGASNGLAKRKLGFAPRKLEWLSKPKAAAS